MAFRRQVQPSVRNGGGFGHDRGTYSRHCLADAERCRVSAPVTALSIARRFIGMEEVPGVASNPAILAMLRLDNKWPAGDEVAWCSAFVSYIAWLLDLPRSKSLAARSWLPIGWSIDIAGAEPGFDVVVLKRGGGNQPGPEVTIGAPGHVGFFAGRRVDDKRVLVLAGNQGDSVSIESFPLAQVLGIRRLA